MQLCGLIHWLRSALSSSALENYHKNTPHSLRERAKLPSALQYVERAARLEARAYGAADFATRLRQGAICSRCKRHSEGLRHCTAAVQMLKMTSEREQELDAAKRASDASATSEPDVYHAHLAVAYHNLAVQLAYTQQLGPASAMADVAYSLASNALTAKHRWAKHIGASAQRLRDMHVSTTFLSHSLRPRLAAQQARADAARSELELIAAEESSLGRASIGKPLRRPMRAPKGVGSASLRGSTSLPALVGRQRG